MRVRQRKGPTIATISFGARRIDLIVQPNRAINVVTMPKAKHADQMNQTIAEIAARILGVGNLAPHNIDSVDFHELSVTSIRRALEAAYEAGRGVK